MRHDAVRLRPSQRGFSYLLLLFIVAIMGVVLSLVGEGWARHTEHEKAIQEAWELKQIARARQRYYDSSPGTVKEWPRTTEEMLEDRRYLGVRRHLREDYRVPKRDETVSKDGRAIKQLQREDP